MNAHLRRALLLIAAYAWLGLPASIHAAMVTIDFASGAYTPPVDSVYIERVHLSIVEA